MRKRRQCEVAGKKACGSSSPFPNSKSGAFVLVLCLKVEWLGFFFVFVFLKYVIPLNPLL